MVCHKDDKKNQEIQYLEYICIKVASMKIKFVLLSTILALSSNSNAQIGGKRNFAFLNMPASSRQVALGSNFISTPDNDISMS